MRLGIIGLGHHIQRSHLVNYLRSPHVTSICYYDVEEKPEVKLPFVETIPGLLARVDVVVIGSPDQYHADQLHMCIDAGKHVFVEKPLATNSAQLKTVRRSLLTAKTKGLVVSTCHPRRFDPPIVWLKHHLKNGPVAEFKFIFHYSKPSKPWKRNRSLMLDHVCHEYELMRYLMPDSVPSTATCIHDSAARYKVEGCADTMAFTFEGNRVLEGKTYQEFIEIQRDGYTLLNLTDGRVFFPDGSDHPIGKKNFELMFKAVDTNFIETVRAPLKYRKPYISIERILEVTSFAISVVQTRQ